MSDYYLLEVNCDLKVDTPAEVIDTLKYMTRTEDYDFDTSLDYPLFDETSFRRNTWRYILKSINQPLQDFPGWKTSNFQRVQKWPGKERYTLSFRLEFHEDEFGLWFPELLEWLALYSETEFVGYYYHTGTSIPELIYFEDGKANLQEIRLE